MSLVFADPIFLILLSLFVAFLVTYVSIPSIVEVARAKHLFDEPNGRTSHLVNTPTLGGMAIYAGFIISGMIFVNITKIGYVQYVLAGSIIIFFLGLKDDILSLSPMKKLLGQIVAAAIIIDLGDVRFTNLHGFLGIHEIGYITSAFLSLFVIIVTINAFNLIDGIDGLAAGVGILAVSFFGIWFYFVGHIEIAVLAAALGGALMAFFKFNVFSKKNKIFMGDIGSLSLGFFISVMMIRFNEINIDFESPYAIHSSPVVTFGILIIPMFDTLRVFTIRIARGQSPFSADKLHVHHRLISLGISHRRATAILLFINVLFIGMVLLMKDVGMYWLGLLVIGLALVLSYLPVYLCSEKKTKGGEQRERRERSELSGVRK